MDFYTGQILPLAISYAPKQTALCNGQSLPITQNAALYALLGTSFGGGGTNFSLPNTGGRTLVGIGKQGAVMPLGTVGGESAHTLTLTEMPTHTHALNASTNGTVDSDPSDFLPGTGSGAIYGGASQLLPLGGAPMSTAGSGQAHDNMQPSTAINFAIVLYGIYPSRG